MPPLGRDAIAPREGLTYLNHAAAGVLPRRTRDAIVALVDGQANAGILGILPVESHLTEFGERIGAFIGARRRDRVPTQHGRRRKHRRARVSVARRR